MMYLRKPRRDLLLIYFISILQVRTFCTISLSAYGPHEIALWAAVGPVGRRLPTRVESSV